MRKKLRIAQIAPLWYAIPPEKYGGTERIISTLTEGLVKRGHDVTLFASGDSKTKAKLQKVVEKGLQDLSISWGAGDVWNFFNHSFAFEQAKKFDIIHCHWNLFGAFFQKFVKTPIVHTLHNTPPHSPNHPNFRFWKALDRYGKKLNLVFISNSEAKIGRRQLKKANCYVLYNGIEISKYKFNPKPKIDLVWVGRICDAKGPDLAIEIAKKAKSKIDLAGQIQDIYKNYFDQIVKPRLNKNVKYVGEFSTDKLSSFYGSAKALVYPIRWEEPFGLVMAEAMACGTPVIVFNHGSAKEVVKDGKTGFVVNNVAQAVKAVKKIDTIKREDCRRWVEDNFTIEKMVDNYEKLYYKVLNK